jgi:hypothetical protein
MFKDYCILSERTDQPDSKHIRTLRSPSYMDSALRFREIDFTRGVAILMMIVFHTVFDLNFFMIAPVNVSTGFWRWFAISTASLFLLVAGVSLVVSHARSAGRLSGFALTKKFLYRGAGIFALGLLVTLATWLFLHEGFIMFGILHLIGVSVMLSPLFFRFGKYNVLFGLLSSPGSVWFWWGWGWVSSCTPAGSGGLWPRTCRTGLRHPLRSSGSTRLSFTWCISR